MTEFLNAELIVAICFVIFVYLSYRPVKKAILAALDANIAEIKAKLAETEKIKKDAKKLLDEIEEEMKKFEKRKEHILENAKHSTERLIELREKEMDHKLARLKDSAIKHIETEKVRAGEKMKAEFIESVIDMVQSYLVETKNNSVSDEEIFKRLIKK
jgi:F-type H+-transporting ATPase subunit b